MRLSAPAAPPRPAAAPRFPRLLGALALVLACLLNVAHAAPSVAVPTMQVDLGATSAQIHNVVTRQDVSNPERYANTHACVRYSPRGGGSTLDMTTTATVTSGSGQYAAFSYGRYRQNGRQVCPDDFSDQQSSVGFLPGDTRTVSVGAPFLIGTMHHHNAPIFTDPGSERPDGSGGALISGGMEVDLANTIRTSFPWTLDETSNICRSTFDASGDYDPSGNGGYAFDSTGAIGPRASWQFRGWSSDYHYAYDRSGRLRSFPAGDTSASGSDDGALYGLDGRSCEDDVLTMTAVSSDSVWADANGVPYKLVLRGFVNNGRNETCTVMDPETAEARLETSFVTQENNDTYGCLYGSLEQVRQVTFAKDVSGSAITQQTVGIPQFTYTNVSQTGSSALEGLGDPSPLRPTGWGGEHAATDPRTYELFAPGGGAAVREDQSGPAPTESTPGWRLSGVTCTQGDGTPLLDQDGRVLDQTDAVNLDAGTLDLDRAGLARSSAEVPITCTWHNEYVDPTPRLRVEKTFIGSDATAGTPTLNADYAITVTNDGSTAQDTGALVDRPDLAPGLTVNTVWASQDQGLLGQPQSVVQGTDDGYRLTEGVPVQPGQSQVFYVRVNATLDPAASGYTDENLGCSQTGSGAYEAGHGLFNEVLAEDGKDVDGPGNNTACGPVDPGVGRLPVTIHKTGVMGDVSGAVFDVYSMDPSTPGAAPVDRGVMVNPDDGSLFTTVPLDINHDYWLVETQAPAGHQRLSEPVGFHLAADGVTLLDPETAAGTVTVSRTGRVPDTITIHDTAIAVPLPLTGGGLARLLPALGAAALFAGSGAAALHQRRARRRNAR